MSRGEHASGRGAALLLAVALAVSWPLREQAEASRRSAGIAPASPLAAIRPGEFAGTLLLGGFRALAVDVLWLQAETYREEFRYWELPAVYELITRIQPHIGVVWEYHAYTMAYDIPFYETGEDARWGWLRQALILLEEGVAANPRDPDLATAWANLVGRLVARRPHHRARFIADGRLNPDGEVPEWAAARRLQGVVALDGHRLAADRQLLLLMGELAEQGQAELAQLRGAARALIDHVGRDHGTEAAQLLDDPRHYRILRAGVDAGERGGE